jgi:hypothetical protein
MWTALGQTAPASSPQASSRRPNAGRLWVEEGGRLVLRDVTIGFSNGAFTELVATDLPEGSAVVTNVTLPAQKSTNGSTSPLLSMTPGAGRGFGPPQGQGGVSRTGR